MCVMSTNVAHFPLCRVWTAFTANTNHHINFLQQEHQCITFSVSETLKVYKTQIMCPHNRLEQNLLDIQYKFVHKMHDFKTSTASPDVCKYQNQNQNATDYKCCEIVVKFKQNLVTENTPLSLWPSLLTSKGFYVSVWSNACLG